MLQALSQGQSEITGAGFLIELTNSGNTGTKNLSFYAKCHTSTENLRDPWPMLYQGTVMTEKVPQFIGPHATIQSFCGFDIDHLRAIGAGREFGYIMVDAIYRDRLDDTVEHRTQATSKISQVVFGQAPGPSGSLGLNKLEIALSGYGRHNCADEECPQ